MGENAKKVWTYMSSWFKGATKPLPNFVIKNAMLVQMPETSYREAVKQLTRKGYIRVNGSGAKITYTRLRTI